VRVGRSAARERLPTAHSGLMHIFFHGHYVTFTLAQQRPVTINVLLRAQVGEIRLICMYNGNIGAGSNFLHHVLCSYSHYILSAGQGRGDNFVQSPACVFVQLSL